jgi:hypothetical protein
MYIEVQSKNPGGVEGFDTPLLFDVIAELESVRSPAKEEEHSEDCASHFIKDIDGEHGEPYDCDCRVGQRLDIALRSPAREEPVVWTTTAAMVDRDDTTMVIKALTRNVWGKDGVPLYTHPQPKPTPVLTVEQVERLRSFVVASPATSASMSKKRREILEWINMLTTTPHRMSNLKEIREAVTHELKCHPEPFQAVKRGDKLFEFRKDDRDFRVGDTLRLREWIPDGGWINGYKVWGHYTGRECARTITYIIREGFGIPEGYCIMSLSTLEEQPKEQGVSQELIEAGNAMAARFRTMNTGAGLIAVWEGLKRDRAKALPNSTGTMPADTEKSGLVKEIIIQHAVADWKQVLSQREEVLKAFVAKYGMQPNDVEQVTGSDPACGNSYWYLRAKR